MNTKTKKPCAVRRANVAYARAIGVDAIQAHTAALAPSLRDALTAMPDVTVQDQGQQKCGIVTFITDGVASDTSYTTLHDANTNVSATPLSQTRLDLGPRGLAGVVRTSVHYYNVMDEDDRFITAPRRIG